MAGLPSAARGGRVTGSLVEGVNHVYVPIADASAAVVVLADHLGLPVLWPFTSFGTFSSGGMSVGSIKPECGGGRLGVLDSQLQP